MQMKDVVKAVSEGKRLNGRLLEKARNAGLISTRGGKVTVTRSGRELIAK